MNRMNLNIQMSHPRRGGHAGRGRSIDGQPGRNRGQERPARPRPPRRTPPRAAVPLFGRARLRPGLPAPAPDSARAVVPVAAGAARAAVAAATSAARSSRCSPRSR